MSQQLLPKLLKGLESASPGIDFCPVLLPRGGKGLGNRHKMPTALSTTDAWLGCCWRQGGGEGAQSS